jgi:glutathione S-transferase
MAESYRIFGAEMSPYSVRVRCYFRYKGIPHQWILRNAESEAEYAKYAKLPIIPLVVTPQGVGIQDSTPIIDKMEMMFPQPSIHPDDSLASFISELIEEFGDEWGNKWMFHYRWSRDVDQISSAGVSRACGRRKRASSSTPPLRSRCGRAWRSGWGSSAPTT